MTPKPEVHWPEDMLIRTATTDEDRPEVERLTKGLIKILKKFGSYEPEVDDIQVSQIATCTIYSKKSEKFLDAPTATEHTYSRVVDTKTKLQKMIDTAIRELSLSRRDRLNQQGQTDLTRQLQEAIAKAKAKKQ